MADDVQVDKPVAKGYKSKAINAVADYAEQVAPVPGHGVDIDQTPTGRRVSLADRSVSAARSAWMSSPRLLPHVYGAAAEWAIDVLIGTVTGSDGAELPITNAPELADDETAVTLASDDMPTDPQTGLKVATITAPPEASGWLVVARSGDDADTHTPGASWALAWVPASSHPCGDATKDVAPLRRVPIATVTWSEVGAPPSVQAMMPGVIHLGVAGPHFGVRADDVSETPNWSVDNGQPGRLPVVTDIKLDKDGKPVAVKTDVRLDGRGNVYQLGDVPDPDDPDNPNPVDPDAPPCGKPLNRPGGGGATDNPLDHPAGGGSGPDRPDRDPNDNPLDHEGEGGYTPACGDKK